MTELSLRRRFTLLTLAGALWALPTAARESGEPQRFHVVYSGQRLTSIAKRYKVSVEAIRTANGLSKNARLKPGEKLTIPGLDDPDGTHARTLYPPQHPSDIVVPASTRSDKDDKDQDGDRDSDADDGPRTHKVYSGQRLESIAKRYQITVDALCAANGITRRVTLRAGQLLAIPRPGDSIESLEAEASGKHGKLPRVGLRKGYLDLFTYSEHFHGYALDKKGKVTPTAQAEVAKLFGATGTRPATDPRLIRLLAKVSDKFGSRPIRIVSGYRTRSFFEDSQTQAEPRRRLQHSGHRQRNAPRLLAHAAFGGRGLLSEFFVRAPRRARHQYLLGGLRRPGRGATQNERTRPQSRSRGRRRSAGSRGLRG